jgi:exopolysaccharide biosynthesis polyprenyl glycosylphosphotransferase
MWILGIILLGLCRILYVYIENKWLKKGFGSKSTLIIGTDDGCQDLAEKIILNPRFRFKYVGFLGKKKPELIHYHLENKFHLLGPIESFEEVCIKNKINVIFINQDFSSHLILEKVIVFCEKSNIDLHFISYIDLLNSGMFSMSYIDDLLLFSFEKFKQPFVQLLLKRIFDITISVLLLVLTSPILMIVAISIKIFSPLGPILFIQERIGKNGYPFSMIKFRSMVPDAEIDTGPVIVNQEKETRYIPFIGQWIRKTSIDEIPQFINVLKGEMSLVGPRPERPFFVEKFCKDIPYYHLRHKVNVGLTGWAQINGRSVLSTRPKHKAKYDLYYIKNWSFLLDIKIILKTIKVVISREKAY